MKKRVVSNANWRVTDSQSHRRKAVLSYEKGNLIRAAQYCKYLLRSSNDKEVRRKAKLDGLHFGFMAKKKRLTYAKR